MRPLIIESCLMISLTVIIYLFGPQASELLAYYHSGIAQFEFWRLITATFCHTNFNHLAMNLVGLVITLALFIETFKKMRLWPLIIFNSVFISLCLYLFEPSVIWYVGFSGVLHGLFSYGALSDIGNKSYWGYLVGGILVAKLIHEQFFGAAQSTIDLIGAAVLVNAHLYGAVAGGIFYVIKLALKKRKR